MKGHGDVAGAEYVSHSVLIEKKPQHFFSKIFYTLTPSVPSLSPILRSCLMPIPSPMLIPITDPIPTPTLLHRKHHAQPNVWPYATPLRHYLKKRRIIDPVVHGNLNLSPRGAGSQSFGNCSKKYFLVETKVVFVNIQWFFVPHQKSNMFKLTKKNSKIFEIIPKRSRMLEKVPEICKLLYTVPKISRMVAKFG